MNAPRHVVVLGGTGFVGQHLVPRLVRAGHRVTVLSRNRELQRQLLVVPGVRVVTTNVYSQAALVERFNDADAVINLVGILNERGFSGAGFTRAHTELTSTIIDACRVAGVTRVLQMSALNAGRGSSHYLRSRGEAEAALKASSLDWTLFQPSVIFGRGDGLFTRFANLLDLSPVLPLARADAKMAPVFVGDVADAFVGALRDDATIRQTYELYGPQVLTLADIVRTTARLRGQRRLVIPLPDALGRLQATLMDFVPGKPFSTDNYRSLAMDSVGGIDGLYRLGIERTPIDAIVPDLLRASPRQRRLDIDRAGG